MSSMDKIAFQKYLHEHIPLSAAMQCQLETLERDCVVISAPLEPNLNHRATAFGGSVSTLATLAAWTLVHTRLQNENIHARVVIQRHEMSYDKPVTARFQATCNFSDAIAWQRFVKMLQIRGRGRIRITAVVEAQQEMVGKFTGDFVAIIV